MKLHNNSELFAQVIREVAAALSMSEDIVEKDYHVTRLLRELTQQIPELVFKGGTSLSKCYNVIKRFSEDIDLTYYSDGSPATERVRRDINHAVRDIAARCGYRLTNNKNILSKNPYNRFVFDYTPVFTEITAVRHELIVETVFDTYPFSYETRKVCSYIGDYAVKSNLGDVYEPYDLSDFDVRVQTIERTFLDKVFALCDYYIDKKVPEHSRHLYDLYKLIEYVDKNGLHELVGKVREQRLKRHQKRKDCPSSVSECDVNGVLKTIYDTDCYKSDYKNNTKYLLCETLPYEKAKTVLLDIIELGIF